MDLMNLFGVELPGENKDAHSRERRPVPPFMRGFFDREERPIPPFMQGWPEGKPPFDGFSPESFMKQLPFGRPPFAAPLRTEQRGPFERGEARRHSGGDPFSGPIGELLRLFFQPSDYDGFYED